MEKPENSVSNFICKQPFNYVQVFDSFLEGCCWDWCKATTPVTDTLEEAWRAFRDFRKASLDGNITKYCNLNCPFLKQVLETGNTYMSMFDPRTPKTIKYYSNLLDTVGPREIRVSCDDSCNLYCKTCRSSKILNPTGDQKILDKIDTEWNVCLEKITFLGSGDPIFSKSVRSWIKKFVPSNYPNLREIQLHTNAQLLTEKVWNTDLKNIVPFVKTMEVSIDAATKETYEKIRRGGKWETLLKNLEFLTNQESIRFLTFSFVVQRDNYREIKAFYDFFKPLIMRTGRGWEFGFNKVMHWGRLTDREFEEVNVFSDEEAVKEIVDQINSLDKAHVRTNI